MGLIQIATTGMDWLQLLVKYWPAVVQVVYGVESVMAHLPGAAKKQIVMGTIQGSVPLPEGHVKAIGLMVDTLVKTLNEAGAFHSAVKAAV